MVRGGEEYSFKVSVNAKDADTYSRALQAISYIAEAAKQDAYIENLGDVDRSEVSSQSLIEGIHTPTVTIPFKKTLSQREIALIQKAFMDESTDELPLDATVTKDGSTFSMPTWLLEYSDGEDLKSKYKKYKDFFNNWFDKIENVYKNLNKDGRLKGLVGEEHRRTYEETRFHSANFTEGTERNYSEDSDNNLRQWGKSQKDERVLSEAEGKEIKDYVESLLTPQSYSSQKTDNNILNISKNEYTDEFRRLQEGSLKLNEKQISKFHRGQRVLTKDEQQRLAGIHERLLSTRNGDRNSKWTNLTGKGHSFSVAQVNWQLFHDIFQINRQYLPNGELVDLHDNYDDCKCFLTSDGMAGFAVEPDGNLVSVFSLNPAGIEEKKGFLYAIKDFIIEQGATHLDCYSPEAQPLMTIYQKVFGFKHASIMDYNMEFDHDDIAQKHNNPKVTY